MGEKKVLALVMFVMAYGLAVTTFIACQVPQTCNGYEPLFFQCVPYLVNPDLGFDPTPHCCEGATVALRRANNAQAIRNLCDCLVDAGPYLGFYPAKLVQLPIACKIGLSFSMDHCIYG
ncbi:Non-specific lipid-transfer protein AP10 [Spatholobus suberectus]|nr:Non-specific lipid-transfer protein AP10 [Spatholobus suberectus]